MAQLKVQNILALLRDLETQGMSKKEIAELPVYIGDDDELNGIHTAWYAQKIDPADEDDAEAFVSLINENRNNIECTEKAILIS